MKIDEKTDLKKAVMIFKKKILESLKSIKDTELKNSKKVFFDKRANQFSIKIPKSFILKARLDENSIFDLVLRTKNEETLDEIKNSSLVIFARKNEKT